MSLTQATRFNIGSCLSSNINQDLTRNISDYLHRAMWVFGYGSLVWKADFPYEKKIVGHIKGYVRRFYQKSPDHRGIPSRPGRVTTLIASEDPQEEVWGLAYKISPEDINHVVNHLDFRERHGYTRKTVLFYPCEHSTPARYVDLDALSHNGYLTRPPAVPEESEQAPFHLTIYIAVENNPNFAGNEDLGTIARTIIEAQGTSGENREYLYKLASAMRVIAPNVRDKHLFDLEEAVKKLEQGEESTTTSTSSNRVCSANIN